ncbi:hypothetical protein DM01DRAFT_1141246 [Hesseltinella vesiculosa]|uniref:HECT-type E3 ubiquitin transferase n=1 Tax=Hesseltinella vesiculosa TaxID=101127 RepID=A0A1X2G896_9FUNG|nr:hypothetical protein DM01DRAFT_1141246 [Hesseltinella vesiculosa]
MNFSFEGNYKSKRNINLGGVRTQSDKKSLMAKAQEERKAREKDRLRWKSAIRIQSFYRGRTVAGVCRQEWRRQLDQALQHLQSAATGTYSTLPEATDALVPCLVLCLRLLLLLSQSSPCASLSRFYDILLASQAQMSVANEPVSWLQIYLTSNMDSATKSWLTVLLAERLILKSSSHESILLLHTITQPSHYPDRSTYLSVMTHLLTKGQLLASVALYARLYSHDHGVVLDVVSSLLTNLDSPGQSLDLPPPAPLSFQQQTPPVAPLASPFSWAPITSPAPAPTVLSRAYLLQRCAMDILTVPGIISYAQLVSLQNLPFGELLGAILDYFQHTPRGQAFADEDIACLWINITMLSQHASLHLQQSLLIPYLQTLQTLLCKLPVHYLSDPTQTKSDLDSSDSEEDNQQPESAPLSYASPWVKDQLAQLYTKANFKSLLLRFVDLCHDTALIGPVSSLFVTFLVRWPAQKDALLNTLLYHQPPHQPTFIELLWQTWHTSTVMSVFENNQIIYQLEQARDALLDAPAPDIWSILYLFCELESRLLLTVGDDEFYNQPSTHHLLSLDDIARLATCLK